MLNCNEIYLLIETELYNLGSLKYADFTQKEIDSEINQILYSSIEEMLNNKKRSTFEQSFINTITKEICVVPEKTGTNTYKVPLDNQNVIYGKGTTLDTTCKRKADSIENNKYYEVQTEDAKYVDTWYKKCDIVKGGSDSSIYGVVKEIKKTEKVFYNVNSSVYSTFENTYSVLGNELLITTSEKLQEFCYNYIDNDNLNKIDCCNNKTLEYNEKIQRYIIDKVVIKLSTISEQNQNKINNLVTLNK